MLLLIGAFCPTYFKVILVLRRDISAFGVILRTPKIRYLYDIFRILRLSTEIHFFQTYDELHGACMSNVIIMLRQKILCLYSDFFSVFASFLIFTLIFSIFSLTCDEVYSILVRQISLSRC